MEKFDINPFDRTALKEYRLLAGRANEYRKVRFVLRNSSKQINRFKSVIISGSRGVGKTSFLNLIENESIENNIIPVRINLTETNTLNSNEFFWYLFSQTINKCFSLNLFGGKGGVIDSTIQKILHGDGLNDQVNWVFRTPILRRNYIDNNSSNFEFDLFAEDLKLIRSEFVNLSLDIISKQTKIVFLVDESQYIYAQSKIIQDIRFVIQNQDLGIGFVFAGDSTFESSTWEEVFGGSYRDFEIINLNYFTEVQDIVDYFRKSLESVGWTTNEIEQSLFYRFKLACRQIFKLTSGNPAWINTIASKMFERCMTGEASLLKFDRLAQLDVKYLLENSGQIDKVKLEYIEGLSPTYKKWLSELFACELHTMRQVYFFSKFKLIDDILTIEEFERFCDILISKEILQFIDIDEAGTSSNLHNLDRLYFSFNFKSDTIKQWLQINSDGQFRFSFDKPSRRFIKFLNESIVVEKANSAMIRTSHDINGRKLRLSEIIEQINANLFNVEELPYDYIDAVYKACKRLANSRVKQSLFIQLTNGISQKVSTWNIYNYDDKEKFIEYNKSPARIEKLTDAVKKYNDELTKLTLNITIDNLESPNLNLLQASILKSGDKKKFGIILDDKDSDLIDYYIKQSDIKSSYDIASFFYVLFEEGFDLLIRNLNNAAYVFIVSNEITKAKQMLLEAKRLIGAFDFFNDGSDSAADIALYNLAVIDFKNEFYDLALQGFSEVVKFYEDNDKFSGNAGVLQILRDDGAGKLLMEEIKEDDTPDVMLSCKSAAIENIRLLKESLAINNI